MREEIEVLALWSRQIPYKSFLWSLSQVESGERLIAASWMDDDPNLLPLKKKSIADLREGLRLVRNLKDQGIRILLPGDRNFPDIFLKMPQPARVLFVMGELNCSKNLSVVGSREPSGASLAWAEAELGKLLDQLPLTIVSGGARGIDQCAHRVALRKGCPTQVFLPSGILRPYPQGIESWLKPILDGGGAFVSEYNPYTPVHRFHFAARNRLIAGISVATLIIEARIRSGTMLTAQSATDLGRPVFVVPSHPYDSNSRGGLNLVADGATIVRDAVDMSIFLAAELSSQMVTLNTRSSDMFLRSAQV